MHVMHVCYIAWSGDRRMASTHQLTCSVRGTMGDLAPSNCLLSTTSAGIPPPPGPKQRVVHGYGRATNSLYMCLQPWTDEQLMNIMTHGHVNCILHHACKLTLCKAKGCLTAREFERILIYRLLKSIQPQNSTVAIWFANSLPVTKITEE